MAIKKDSVQISIDIEASQGVKEFQSLLDKSKDFNNQMRKLKRQGKENTDEFKRLEKQAEEVNKELAKLGGAGANMGQLKKRAAQLNRELNTAVEGTAKFVRITKELKSVNDRLATTRAKTKGVAEGMNEVRMFGMTLPPVFQKAAGGINMMQNAMKAFVALQVVQYFIQLFQVVDETTKRFVKLRGVIEQSTGATGDELDNYTTRLSAISTTFKKDSEEVFVAANALTKQLTGDFSKSLELIEKGFVAGADRSGDFLNQIKEYPTFFKEMKLSGEQMISVISQSIQEGVFSDKGVDMLKEFEIRVREMTPATQKALRNIGITSEEIGKKIEDEGIGGAFTLVQSKLKDIRDDAPATGQALADIFGGPGEDAGLQFIQILDLTDNALNDLIDTSNDYTAAMMAQLEADTELAEAQNRVAKGFKDTSNSLSVYISKVKAFLFTVAADVLEFFEELPATAQGQKAALEQIGENFVIFFKRMLIDARIALKEIEKLNPFGKTSAQIDEEIKALHIKRIELQAEAQTVAEAYRDAYLKGLQNVETNKKIREALTPTPTDQEITDSAKTFAEKEAKAIQKARQEVKPVNQLGTKRVEQVTNQTNEIDTESAEARLKNKFLKALITEQEYEDQRHAMMMENYQRRLDFLQSKFGEESAAFINLENEKLQAQQTYEQQRLELIKRTEETKQQMQTEGLSAFSDFIGATIELLGDEEGARKKNSLALKAFSVGKVVIDTEEAIMSILKNSEANPANILFPGAGKLISGIKIATILAKSTAAISKINQTGFYQGGHTGNTPLFKDNAGRDVVGAVHSNEWVAPEWQVQHPVYGRMINYLENMRQRGFEEGGFATADLSFNQSSNQTNTSTGTELKVLESAVMQMIQSQQEMTAAIKQKQFNVMSGQIYEAMDEEYRLRSKTGF